MDKLTQSEIIEKAKTLTGWEVWEDTLRSERKFKDFVEAIAFVNRLVEPAEAADHHPDLAISYNRVTISLTTHDAGGLTEKDFALAQAISQIA
ncbi:4a-hydroxytetrahydrobiopterin dehydratase [Roseofilum casamattae]|uniref:Putative pterin-4-alpha-carbinolamine dehydratase n=1 Tax=Roseofilum casamattae BLCC-M143 TaxID=3022442 RepID=A0ABT7C0Y1_9CYAN|nr:4a-hydroxytetrahydrobiopterin dehydratase [Roseofilum casamattae]MDJ1185115.1 4a-hydroxytetrahydrobiopterin dehydratase [Roseofilum casamattae BLCC-M143]